MFYFWLHLFDTRGYLPRGFCGGWGPQLLTVDRASHVTIWLAYMFITALLVLLVRRREQMFLPPRFYVSYACFIFTCGLTHLMLYVETYEPVYRVGQTVQVLCAASSWAAVLVTVELLFKFKVRLTVEHRAPKTDLRGEGGGL